MDSRAAPIDPRILDQAADWLVLLGGGTATDADRSACERWRQADPEHARAWARAERLLNKLGSVPSALAMPALDRPVRAGRRAAVGKLAALLVAAPGAWLAWRLTEDSGWWADHRTAAGETRELQLADGSRLTLAVATRVDLRFDAGLRLVRLLAGEILVRTAADRRPFVVDTAQGRVEALGTHFDVRQDAGSTRVAVLESAVRITPARVGEAGAAILRAGYQADFSAVAVAAARPVDAGVAAWTRGMLLADRMRLADFAAELARYRGGIVRCDPAVADIAVSGAFPIARTERALDMLASTYPVSVVSRLGGYWITLAPR